MKFVTQCTYASEIYNEYIKKWAKRGQNEQKQNKREIFLFIDKLSLILFSSKGT